MRVQSLQERGRKRSRRSKPRARWDVGQGGDLDLRGVQLQHADRLADDRMLYLVDFLDVLQPGVFQKNARREGPDHGHVDIAVDGRGDEKTAVALVIRWQVGAAASQGDSQRASGNDHGLLPTWVRKL